MPSELGRLLLPSIHSKFLSQRPDVDLDLTLVDHHVDLISEGYDIIFRVGSLPDSNLKARVLAGMEMTLVASPAFLNKHGEPITVDDLRDLPFVRYQLGGQTYPVIFDSGEMVVPHGRIGLDSGFGLRTAALGGMGVAYVMRCTVQDDLARALWLRCSQIIACPLFMLYMPLEH
jgi:DNA-binding transcriptional LysR family regulator